MIKLRTGTPKLRLGTRFCISLGLLILLTLSPSSDYAAKASQSANRPLERGFALVSQALQARSRLVYVARQDILWAAAAPGSNLVQIVADIACSGRRKSIAYRFPPEAAGRVMLDDGSRSTLYDPQRRALIIGQSASEEQSAVSSETLALLHCNYDCVPLRRETLNGSLCDVVSIRPRLENGPSRQLWIDTKRHAILRTEEYDAQGCCRYASSYENIRFLPRLPAGALDLPAPARDPRLKRITIKATPISSASQAFAAAKIAGHLPAWCPAGYTLLHCAVGSAYPKTRAVFLYYGDGLKTLLVIEESRSGALPTTAELSRTLGRYGQRAWVRDDKNVRIVVRGDLWLPSRLGEEMMEALQPHAAGILARAVAQDFGAAEAHQSEWLRDHGWGYRQIGTFCLWVKRHPKKRSQLRALIGQNADWSRMAEALGSQDYSLEARARRWVASTLAAHQ